MNQPQRQNTTATPTTPRLAGMVALLLSLHHLTPAQCFGPTTSQIQSVSSSSRSRTSSSSSSSSSIPQHASFTLFYSSPQTQYLGSLSPLDPSSPSTSSSTTLYPSDFLSSSASDYDYDASVHLPTWLKLPRSHLVEANREALRNAMRNTRLYTELEVLQLESAIREASQNDNALMAGALEFCTLLVETMELGLDSLIAAAFHYTACVQARKQSTASASGTSSTNSSNNQDYSYALKAIQRSQQETSLLSDKAVQIARDAARLKHLELVASSVIQNTHHKPPSPADSINLKHLYLTEAKDWRALAIRSAASLFRLRGILKSGITSAKLTPESVRAAREALHIYAPLASRMGLHRLKNELEDAAFRILYRRQYEYVESLLHQTRSSSNMNYNYMSSSSGRNSSKQGGMSHPKKAAAWQRDIAQGMEQVLGRVQHELTELLQHDPEFTAAVQDFTVTARVKEAYSTWKKMLRNRSDHILQVPDAIALRVVFNALPEEEQEDPSMTQARERALSYYIQQRCMEQWAPSASNPRIKDYIAHPKPNGYQSLHYTATTKWEGQEWNVEIQIRSGEMHKVAEFGLASHWEYKEGTQGQQGYQQSYYQHNDDSSSEEAFPAQDAIVTALYSNNHDKYLRSLQEWHWREHGGVPQQTPEEHNDYSNPMYTYHTDDSSSQVRSDRIRQHTQVLAPYIEALGEAQTELVYKHVFVFLSEQDNHHNHNNVVPDGSGNHSGQGKLMALPAGAVVLDALRECDRAFVTEEYVLHNGTPASLTSRLQNGDVVSIPTVTVTTSN